MSAYIQVQPAAVSMSYACTICGEWEDLPVYMQHSNIPEMCKQCRADLAEIIKERRAKKEQPKIETAGNRMNFITMCVNSYPNHTVTEEQLEAIERLAKMVYPDNNEKKQP